MECVFPQLSPYVHAAGVRETRRRVGPTALPRKGMCVRVREWEDRGDGITTLVVFLLEWQLWLDLGNGGLPKEGKSFHAV